ncbi:MAG: hypothetical protein ACOYNC_07910 [Bacteroidales bacterium]
MNANGLSRKTVLAGLLAMFLLGVFILFNVFRSYRDSHGVSDPLSNPEREQLPPGFEGSGKRLAFYDFESGNANDSASHLTFSGHSGKQSLKMSSKVSFSPGLWIKFKDLKPGDSSWIRVTGYVWFTCPPGEVTCNLVATCNHAGVNFKYMFVALENENLGAGKWNKVTIDYHIPPAPDAEDVVQAYFWYRGKGEMLVDDIDAEYFNTIKNNK